MRLASACIVALAMVALALFLAVSPGAMNPAYWEWAKWRLGHGRYLCQAGDPALRPAAPSPVPSEWWQRLRSRHVARPCLRDPGSPVPAPNPPARPPAPPPAAPPGSAPPTPPATVAMEAGEAELRDAVNETRRMYGLGPLAVRADLLSAARAHTADLAAYGYFAHEWNDGTPFATWVRRYTACPAVGEILAWRSPTIDAATAVELWLGSPPHREALLAPTTWNAVGVELEGRHATVVFGGGC